MNLDLRRSSTVLAVAAVSFISTEAFHPKPKGATVSEAKIGMLQTDGWIVSHIPQLIALTLLVVGFAGLRRHLEGRAAVAATVAAVGAAVGVVEVAPHMFVAWQVDQIIATGSSPLHVAHGLLQAVATPLLGGGVAALAATAGLSGRYGSRPVAVLGIIGGLGWALAGPAVLLSESMTLAKLFMAGAPLALWLGIASVQTTRRAAREPGLSASASTPSAARV